MKRGGHGIGPTPGASRPGQATGGREGGTVHDYPVSLAHPPGHAQADFGEASFNIPDMHTASAVATERCEFHTLERGDFELLAQAHPALALSVLDVLVGVLGRCLRLVNLESYQLNQF